KLKGYAGGAWKDVLMQGDVSTGITSLNSLTGATQTFATGTSGTDFNISSSGTTHTFNIPDASVTNRGLVTTGTQTFAGLKTFSSLATSGTAPTTTGATKMVVSDQNGLLSFQNIPALTGNFIQNQSSSQQASSSFS